jgi:hypothetical protein
MKTIGIDFDNTIINYNLVFYKIALKKKLINKNINKSKSSVKEYLLNNNKYNEWVKLQGEVYSKYLDQATIYPYCLGVIRHFVSKGFRVVIISHKTKFPYLGKKVNLHKPAFLWIKNKIVKKINFEKKQIFFCSSKEKKINEIKKQKCSLFIDDLEEIFLHQNFPKNCLKILFNNKKESKKINMTNSWLDIKKIIYENI